MSNLSLSSTEIPKNYPVDILKGQKKILPVQIDWTILKNAIEKSSDFYTIGQWKESNVRAFLTTFGLNDSATNHVISHCNNMKALKIANTSNKYSENAKYIINMSQQKPDLFKKWIGGAYWNSSIPFKIIH